MEKEPNTQMKTSDKKKGRRSNAEKESKAHV